MLSVDYAVMAAGNIVIYETVGAECVHLSRIPGPWELGQEGCDKFEVNLIYIVSFRSTWMPGL